MAPWKIAVAAIIVAATAGCATQQPARDLPDVVTPPPDPEQPAAPHFPPNITEQRFCGAFSVLDTLTNDVIAPSPTPGGLPGPASASLVTVANALNTVDRDGLSKSMDAAVRAHVHALTYLGALIDHGGANSDDDVETMTSMVGTTGDTVRELCRE